MASSEKIKTIDNNIEQNKAQYNLDRKTTDILALSSENDGKYEFLMGKDVLLEKGLLGKANAIKKFEYSPLGSELKKQTDIAKISISILKTKQMLLITIERMKSRQQMVSR